MYFTVAHTALVVAAGGALLWPHATAGFFYHPWMVALVHLVTLGWITSSLLGMLYIVGPTATRAAWPVDRGDWVALALVVIGFVGLVSHFWIEEFGGMAWSAATVTAGVLYVMARTVAHIRRARAHRAVRLCFRLASANLAGAAVMGTLLGFDKEFQFLPGYVVTNVFAHAHLAAVGWATLMVMGLGYQLLSTAPSGLPGERRLSSSAWLIEIGVVGLFAALVWQSRWAGAFGLLIVVGLADAGGHVVRVVRVPAAARGAGDDGLRLIAAAAVSLTAASLLGLVLLFVPDVEWWPRLAAAYGAFGLLGFLAQMIAVLHMTLGPPLRARPAGLYCWTLGVPLVAAGLFLTNAAVLRAGAALLLGAAVLASATMVPGRGLAQAEVR